MKLGKHWIKDARAEKAVGFAFLAAAAFLLHDAYERRAQEQPLWLRPLSFW